jgi:hypothetical protein
MILWEVYILVQLVRICSANQSYSFWANFLGHPFVKDMERVWQNFSMGGPLVGRVYDLCAVRGVELVVYHS